MTRLRSEIQWVALGLLLPSVLVHAAYIALTASTVPLLDRLLFREDACPYWSCVLAGLASYGLIGVVRTLRRARSRP